MTPDDTTGRPDVAGGRPEVTGLTPVVARVENVLGLPTLVPGGGGDHCGDEAVDEGGKVAGGGDGAGGLQPPFTATESFTTVGIHPPARPAA